MFKITKVDPLLKSMGRSFYELREKGIISGAVYSNLRSAIVQDSSINITLDTIDCICVYFGVHPFDFLEYVPEFRSDYVEKHQERIEKIVG